MTAAVFLGRDGVINETVYNAREGIFDSPSTIEQFKLYSGSGQAVRRLHELGYKVILVSNQPGIAKGNCSWETFEMIRLRMREGLAKEQGFLDGEYYCFHHPEAIVKDFRTNCTCRKPKPGLLIAASANLQIDLAQSWMIGDNLNDIQAGIQAGCRTILLGAMKCDICRAINHLGIKPEVIKSNLLEAVSYLHSDVVYSGA